MAHIHSVKDTDVHYKIDGITRTIVNVNETKRMLVQNDHNSERLTFEVPRYVDGHDLTTCNVVQVHYLNTDTYEENASSGVYEVDDLGIKGATGDDANIVILTWLVSGNATKYIGTLNFIIRFSCVTDGNIDYAWNTTVFKGITILEGIFNSNEVVEQNVDILEQWKRELIAAGVDALTLDSTLMVEGEAADARATGDAIRELEEKVEQGSGFADEEKILILTLFQNAVFTTDQSGNIESLYNLFNKINVAVTGIILSKSTLNMYTVNSTTLTAKLTPSGATGVVVWKSSDESVATVTQTGMVTPIGSGSCVITASVGENISASCTVNVDMSNIIDITQNGATLTIVKAPKVTQEYSTLIIE